MKKITLGIIAHVDAGKTTFSESLLYNSGAIRNIGRVDHGSSFLDTDIQERQRGITIYSREARFQYGNKSYIIVDTPGHVDFSPEMERCLSVIDYAVLLISASEGIQSQTYNIWSLLERYDIPTFVFVNKTDLPNIGENGIVNLLNKELNKNIVSFSHYNDKDSFYEKISLVSDEMLNTYLSDGKIEKEMIKDHIKRRKLFPCYFGSALKNTGIIEFLDDLTDYTSEFDPLYNELGATVYKIEHVINGNNTLRLTKMRVLSGELKVKDTIKYRSINDKDIEEKINQIRIYNGEKYTSIDSVSAGDICSVTGLTETYVGQGIGKIKDVKPVVTPVVKYTLQFLDTDQKDGYNKIKVLNEDNPELSISWNENDQRVEIFFMGSVQIEIIEKIIKDRFDLSVQISDGRVIYKETIEDIVEGIGHFEPLRHYAEVHLILEPSDEGSGIIIENQCSDVLPDIWQKIILTNLKNHIHKGVLTGSILTDVKIKLVSGKYHERHTDASDFREAAIRAVRQGLMKTRSFLLEPYYKYSLSIQDGLIGRAINDLQLMYCTFVINGSNEGFTEITGIGPVITLQKYHNEVASYTSGLGKLMLSFDSYRPCHNEKEIISEYNYDPESDIYESPDSVFCEHGAGYIVKWNNVESKMHLPKYLSDKKDNDDEFLFNKKISSKIIDDKELDAFIKKHLGEIRRKEYSEAKIITNTDKKKERKVEGNLIIVDGYNLIFSWDILKDLAETRLEIARERLIEILKGYSAFTGTKIKLVFDAYLVKDGIEKVYNEEGIDIIYTKENETADTFIEKMIYDLGPDYNIRVITSDSLIRKSTIHAGVLKSSSEDFVKDIESTSKKITELIEEYNKK